jgi:hypothetical protein
MKGLFFPAGLLLTGLLCFLCAAEGGSVPDPLAPDGLSRENSRYEALLSDFLSKDTGPAPEEPASADTGANSGGDIDAAVEENAIDALMKTLRRKEPDIDEKARDPEGSYVVLQEISGTLRPGEIDKICLAALRKADGIYDRALRIEIRPPGAPPFLVPLPDGLRGYESKIELKNFTSAAKSEILLTIKTGLDEGTGRLLVVDAWEKRVFYDSRVMEYPLVQGKFFDGYRAEIIASDGGGNRTHVLIDLSSRKNIYDRNRVYNESSGRLRSAVGIRTVGYSLLQAVDADDDGIYELKGVADLRGAGRNDRVAYMDFTLKYREGAWRLADCWIVPAEDLKLLPLPIRLN